MLLTIGYGIAMLLIFYLLAVICDRYFIQALEIISRKLKLTEDVAWATFMAVGTSAPEFFTAVIAILTATKDVWAWTIIWSAIFNILIITWWSALVLKTAKSLETKSFRRDSIVYFLSVVLLYITFRDGTITLYESLLYIWLYVIYVIILSKWRVITNNHEHAVEPISDDIQQVEEEVEKKLWIVWICMQKVDGFFDVIFPNLDKKPQLYGISFALSILFIIALSAGLVHSGVGFAEWLGVPQVIIALTILAGWTSVPDLLSSLIVAKKWKADMAVANAVWSNIFDILICLWLPRLVYILRTWESIVVPTTGLYESVLVILWIMVIMIFYMITAKYKINKTYGIMLIGMYLAYLAYQIYLAYM